MKRTTTKTTTGPTLGELVARRKALGERAARFAMNHDDKKSLPRLTRDARALARLDERIAQAQAATEQMNTCTRCGGKFPTRTSGITPGAAPLCMSAADCDANIAARKRIENAAGWIQTIPSDILAAAARGDLDLNAIARAELASRGLDRSGKWVGFPAAQRLAAQVPTFNAKGERVFVTIPTDDAPAAVAPVKPTRDEYRERVFRAFIGGSIHSGRGLVSSVAADTADALIADAKAHGLEVVDVTRNPHRTQVTIFGFRRNLTRRERLSAEAVQRAQGGR